jgi:hypothetical protein
MTPYVPSKASQDCIIDFGRSTINLYVSQWNIRSSMRAIDLAYMRETDQTEEQWKAKKANQLGDPTKFQNITLPVIQPQVENAVTYQQSVFLTGYPMFSAVSVPEFASEAAQMDTIIGEQQDKGNWVHECLMCIRDGLKYNLMAAEIDWQREITYSLTTDLGYQDGKEGKPTELLWEGNKIRRMDLYNTFWDTRVAPRDVAAKGEFAGFNELMSRVAFKAFALTLPVRINMNEALNSGFVAPISTVGSAGSMGYYYPQLNPEATVNETMQLGMNWARWAGFENSNNGQDRYKDMYQVTTLYARILPSDFGFKGLPGQNTPQVWKFIIVNSQVVIYCERLTNAHNLIPMVFSQPLDDGLAYQTKSFAKNVQPIQDITTALSNSSIASRRRAISDRMLYDPSRVSAAAINNDSPSAKIPVRPSAYQQELSKAVYAIPFRDDQFQINMAEIQSYRAMANEISGLNPARQGQFVKGNKTLGEFDSVMGNANGRDQTLALTLEGNFFKPIKAILRSNILQYQGGTQLYNRDAEAMITIDPVALRKANLVMKVSDGLEPSSKLINADTLGSAVQLFSQNQAVGAEYNMGDMTAYLFQSAGLKLAPFKKSPQQIAYEQAVGQWQGAVQALATQLVEMQPPMTPEQIQQALVALPQPTPEQFGYVPGTKTLTPGAATTPNNPTILAQMSQTIQAAQQQPAAPVPTQGIQQ